MSAPAADARDHQAIKAFLLTALDLPETARSAWLAQLEQSAGPATADKVRRLLDAHARAGAFLEVPDAGAADVVEPSGRRVGPFVIEREIGRGGMGAVYLGVRDDGGFTQHVAVKVIAADSDGQASARLQDERRILASLSHPFIAHFVEGGTTPDGLPYIAMEYVEGRAITRYCDELSLDVPARLRLFMKVCGAVDFAHQHLVVHRDIKPSNILVTDNGMPKLLDFGIATLTEPGRAGGAATLRVMTPHYASPEQVSGGPVTTAADVYSLGVLLFELLTGEGPYRSVSPDAAPLSVLEAVRDETPERPSLVARRVGRRAFGGDLDAIVLKAMHKTPAGRYRSAGELAQDLGRYLDGQAVLAQPPSAAYRLAKFVRRNRAAVAGASLALASLIGATAVSLWQARAARIERARAEARFEDVRQLARAVLFDLDEAVRAVPGTTAARRLLMEQGLRYLEQLSRDVRDELPLQRELAAGYQRIGDVQGNPFQANLGERRAALASYQHALALREQIARRADAEPADLAALAAALSAVGDMLWADGDFEGARAHFERATDTAGRVFQADRGNADRALIAARSAYQLGQALTKLGRFHDARQQYDASFATLDGGPARDHPAHRRVAAIASLKIGDCRLREGDLEGARQRYMGSAEAADQLLTATPDRPDLVRLQAFIAHRRALVDAVAGHFDAARSRMLSVMATHVRLASLDPDDRQIQRDIASAASTLGAIEMHRGRLAEAERLLTRAVDQYSALAAAGAGYTDLQSEHGATLRRRGDLAVARGDLESALQWYEQATDLLHRDPPDQEYAAEHVLLNLNRARASRALAARRGTPPTDADRWEAEARDEWRQVSARGLKVWMEAFGSPTLIEDRLSDSTRQP